MPRLLLILAALLTSLSPFAQNLVPNPSFEEYENGCPENFNEMPEGWSMWRYHANSFSTCVTPENYEDSLGWAPLNGLGYQSPNDGDSYVGLFCLAFPDDLNNQEYIGTELISPLEIGQEYYVSLMVSATFDNSMYLNMTTACSHLGALFTTQAYHWEDNPLEIPNFAHVFTTDVITDSLNWTNIEGSFIADQAYTHIGIGQFFDGYLGIIDTIHVVTEYESGAYYFVDNVIVEKLEPNTASPEHLQRIEVHVFPNPTSTHLTILSEKPINHMTVYDSVGKQVFSAQVENYRIRIDSSVWPNGIYFIELKTENKLIHYKIIKN